MNEKVKDFFNSISDNWYPDFDQDLIMSLIKESGIKKGDHALDVGCGKGIISNVLFDITKEKVIAIDIADKMIEGANNIYKDNHNLIFICGDYYDYKFDQKFDYVVMYNCYPHFLDVLKLELKTYDILNDNGVLVIMHSLGRLELDNHHKGIPDISRSLLPAKEEGALFNKHFDVIKTIDEDNRYLIVLKKKG